MSEMHQLANGVTLHRWSSGEREWACAVADHGPMCRLCQPVDGVLNACLENVMDGLFDLRADGQTGQFSFHVTDEGNRRVRNMVESAEGDAE